MALLTHAELISIRDECMADDVDLDLELMQYWTAAEAERFFGSGGVIAPPPKQVRSIKMLLKEAQMEYLEKAVSHESLGDWLSRLLAPSGSRHELLRRLKVCCISTLSERQAVVNALAKAWREARVPAHVLLQAESVAAVAGAGAASSSPTKDEAGLPPPIDLWREAVDTISQLRRLTPDELVLRLPNAELRASCDANTSNAHSSAAQCVRAWPAEALGDTLEGLGWPLAKVRLFLEGTGLSARAERPRLGQAIGFWTNQMGERGTEVALYDYADACERCLGMTAWVLHPSYGGFPGVLSKFRRRFGARCVALHWDEVGAFCVGHDIGRVYIIKEGTRFVPDVRMLPPSVHALVHAVFHADQPHGSVYAKISPCVPGNAPVVPHIVRVREPHGPNMRHELGIPADATVFGRHGGLDTFSIDFAQRAVVDVARACPDIYFLFLNTYPLHERLPNVIHVERTSDSEAVSRFIRTCDAMLHARAGGETFGLACAEFSVHNRPVLTSSVHDDHGHGCMHLDVLGAAPGLRRFFYRDYESLVQLLRTFKRGVTPPADCNAYRAFEPSKVMATFERVFLGGTPSHLVGGVSAEELGLAETMDGNGDRTAQDADALRSNQATTQLEKRWVDACERGQLMMEAHATVRLPGANAIFLASCRAPPNAGAAGDALCHVFRADALAMFAESAIHAAAGRACGVSALDGAEDALRGAARLATGEDPRIFAHAGRLFVVDNTMDTCRLLQLHDTLVKGGAIGVDRVYRVALSGKNLTFLPAPCGTDAARAELLLVHWFRPLRVYRVGLADGAVDGFASLECIFVEGQEGAPPHQTIGSGQAPPIDIGDAALPPRDVAARDEEFRGGTPGRPAGEGVWWGLLHRTWFVNGTLRHDPYAWVVRRSGAAFTASLTRVQVVDRPSDSNILDPCSLVEGNAGEGDTLVNTIPVEDEAPAPIFCTTAESESGWFSPQQFRTGVWQLVIGDKRSPSSDRALEPSSA